MEKRVIKRTKTVAKQILAFVLRILKSIRYRQRAHAVQLLGQEGKSVFFGYHDKSPFSRDGSKVLAGVTGSAGERGDSECTEMVVGYFVRNTPGSEYVTLDTTTTWCWQQGCMLQWYPGKDNSAIAYNKMVRGKYGSCIFDIRENRVTREYEAPIYALSQDGKMAVSLDFSRLGRLRPGYGYSLIPDKTEGVCAPEDNGIFLMDMVSGRLRLVVGLRQLYASWEGSSGTHDEHYVNHATFSPAGRYVSFFHMIARPEGKRAMRFCVYDMLKDAFRTIEAGRTVSHYCWRDERYVLATNWDSNKKWAYSIYDVENASRADLKFPVLRDGHPMFHPGNNAVIVTDTYPDRLLEQSLHIVDIDEGKVLQTNRFYSPVKYCGTVRCDLHPRWDHTGSLIAIDTTMSGKRCLGLVKVHG